MKAFRKIVALLIMISLAFTGAAFAATPEVIAEQTYLGMEWLADSQHENGSWGDDIARTGLALLKFETHALNDPEFGTPFHVDYPFKENVENGLDYLFAHAVSTPIGLQTAGDPDSNGNGNGVVFALGGYETYTTSIALMAIIASSTPDRLVVTGPLTGETYGDVAQDVVDYLAYGQTDPTSKFRGGWTYTALNNNSSRSDNSISGYVVMGLAFAEHSDYGFNCTVPTFVKEELDLWVNYIQNDANGGSGYIGPGSWYNILKTGNLLQQMAYLGYAPNDPRVEAAIGFIEDYWNVANQDPGWRGSPSNYQATFTMMKGLESYGIDILTVDGNPVDWFDEVSDVLLDEQLANNSWPQTRYDYETNSILSTTWALLTLQKVSPPPVVTEIDIDIRPGTIKNVVCPKPMGMLDISILGSEEFNVKCIDEPTIRLTMNGKDMEIEPLRWAYMDMSPSHGPHQGDGYCDLILMFSMEDVLSLIEPDLECIMELTIIGRDLDGVAFTGSDVIYLTAPRTAPPSFR
ncbi:hypothetical protein SANA_07940 [Gottschalkiaceae bacterium SANA]|nr:hypothetical protein SANA_07940 [Gottschalkiaceae bacterium SANA]